MRNVFLAFATAISIFVSTTLAQEPVSKPQNIVLIMCDDLNCALGCYGDKITKSPNLDRLANQGTRFNRAYCQFPLCGPSRNSMLTGLYPDANGILENSQIFRQTVPDQRSVPQNLRLESNYWTVRIGKMYHYNVPRSIGTTGHDDPESWEWGINPAGVDRLVEEPDIFSLQPGNFGGTLSWYASPHPAAEQTDALIADAAIKILDLAEQDSSRPLFLAVGFYRPHTPYVSPQSYFDMYDAAQMPLPTDIEKDREDIPRLALASQKKEQDAMTDQQRREAIRAYRASITFVDEKIGKVLKALDDSTLASNTTVIFTSDHGYHLGEHGLWQKQSLFEESARVPLLIRSPGGKGEQVCESPVGLIDLAPTMAELGHANSGMKMHGQSLLPMLQDPSTQGRGWSLSQVRRGGGQNAQTRHGYSIRTPQFRYTRWDDGKAGEELYDHSNDALEQTNLASDVKFTTVVEQHRKMLESAVQQFMPETGRPVVNVTSPPPNLTDANY